MARLGKSTDSPSKSASKNSKRAATKAKQDLDEEFASKIPKTAYVPNPVAVDANPVQIPRKPKVVPVLSLAPPSPMAQDVQDKSCKPPEDRHHSKSIFSPSTYSRLIS